ncbi:MAG TPA: hypothetical protein VHR86_01390, partial [Armatimonadota bacterium]|nr:hypothetical protein [Armatimonadota bacterium]
MKKTRWIALLFALLASAPAQANLTGAAVMQRVQAQRAGIRDYTVDIAIQVRMKKVHVPDSVLRVYHKAPDKTKIQALKGFTVMPKGATPLGDPFAVFTAHSSAAVVGREQVAKRPVIRLRLKAKDNPAAGAMDAWVDSERWVV